MPHTSKRVATADEATASCAAAAASSSSNSSSNSSVASLDIGACCYCHSSLDYSDRAAFFREDRFEDYKHVDAMNNNKADNNNNDDDDASSHKSYVFRPNDPYLPLQFYNPNNALVYCDSCDRLYHQQCHAVPLIVLPRGAWHCLYCQSRQQQQQKHARTWSGKVTAKNKKTKSNQKHSQTKKHADPLQQFWKQFVPSHQQSISPTHELSLFASPPQPAMRQHEQAWFAAVASKLAYATHVLLQHKLPKAIHGQLGTFRLTQAALQTWTSTHKNRQHIAHGTSQAAVDTLVRQAACHYKIQMWLRSVEQVRSSSSSASDSHHSSSPQQTFQALVEWCRDYQQKNAAVVTTTTTTTRTTTKNGKTTKRSPRKAAAAASSAATAGDRLPDDFVQRVIFPFGIPAHTWFPPRTPEFSMTPAKAATTTKTNITGDSKNNNNKSSSTKKNDNNDDDSGISLDGLTCCVCRTSDATDDNDLLLCDGHGCFRAYHMQCVYPALTPQDLGNEDDDWFCPLCCGIADLIHLVQSEYMGDEWEQRRIVRQIENHRGKKKQATKTKASKTNDDDDDDNDSLQSWTHVDQVFPNARWEYETALALQNGTQNADTNALLAQVFGWEMGDGTDDDEEDDDNVEEDEHFDLEAFHEERRREREQLKQRSGGQNANDSNGDDSNGTDDNAGDESSTPSSQATLVDMSSVELEIDKDELAALSEADESSSSEKEDESDDNNGARRSRRLRKHHQQHGESGDGDDSNRDPGKLDVANIIRSKRTRKPVDYIKLNNAIFGDLSDGEAANLDDVEDFQQRKRTPRSSDSDDEEEGGSSDDDDDGDGNNEMSRTGNSCDDKDGDSDDSDDKKAKNKSKKKVSTKTAVTRSRGPSKRQTKASAKSSSDNRLRKETMNGKKRVVSNPSASTRSRKRQKTQSKTAFNDKTSTKPTKKTNDDQHKETKNGVRNARGTSIAQKALNFVSGLVSSPVRKAS